MSPFYIEYCHNFFYLLVELIVENILICLYKKRTIKIRGKRNDSNNRSVGNIIFSSNAYVGYPPIWANV